MIDTMLARPIWQHDCSNRLNPSLLQWTFDNMRANTLFSKQTEHWPTYRALQQSVLRGDIGHWFLLLYSNGVAGTTRRRDNTANDTWERSCWRGARFYQMDDEYRGALESRRRAVVECEKDIVARRERHTNSDGSVRRSGLSGDRSERGR